jgi:hypothetical protein
MAEDSVLVRFTADLSDIKQRLAELEGSIKKVDGQASKTGKNITDAFEKTGKSAEKAKDSADGLAKGIKKTGEESISLSSLMEKLTERVAAAFAIDSIIRFGAESVKAFAEAEANAAKLQNAVSVNGGLQKDFEELIDQSTQLQSATIFSDDQIQQVQTAALQFGLTTQQVQRLIPVITDFASATGQDLSTALDAVLRGAEGAGRGLQLYGVSVDSTKGSLENLDSITEQLNKRFSGQAQIVGETAAGALKKYENQVDDLQESIGERLTPAIQALQLGVLSIVNDFAKLFSGDLFKGDSVSQQIKSAFEFTTPLAKKLDDLTLKQTAYAKAVDVTQLQLARDRENPQSKEYDSLSRSLNNALGDLKAYNAELKNRGLISEQIKKTQEDLTTLTTDELAKRLEIAKQSNLRADKDLVEAINKELERRKKASDKGLTDQEQAYNDLVNSRKKFEAQLNVVAAEGDEERLRAERDNQEKILQEQLTAAGGVITPAGDQSGNLKAVQEFLAAKAALFSAYDKLIQDATLKAEQETADKLLALNQKNAEEDLKATLAAIDKAGEAEKQKRIEDFLSVGDFSKTAYQSLQDDLSAIDRNYTNAKLSEARRAGGDILNLEQKLTQDQIDEINARVDAFEEGEQRKRQLIQDTIDAGANFVSSVADLALSGLDGELAAIEETKNANLARYDEELAALEKRNERGALSDSQYEKQKTALLEKRKKDEDAFNKKSLDIKRQQAAIDKQRAIFEIVLNTAVAVTEALPNALLAALIAAAGAAQLATVVSQPIPKFAKGTRFLDNPAAPAGEDKILFYGDRGERIVPAKKNREYMQVYDEIEKGKKKPLFDAIQNGRFDQYIEDVATKKTVKRKKKNVIVEEDVVASSFAPAKTVLIEERPRLSVVYRKSIADHSEFIQKNYTSHLLTTHRKESEERKQKTFASNIAESLYLNFTGLTAHEADRLRRKGTDINNADEIAHKIAAAVSDSIPKQYGTW